LAGEIARAGVILEGFCAIKRPVVLSHSTLYFFVAQQIGEGESHGTRLSH
jgi:hypothetical protein